MVDVPKAAIIGYVAFVVVSSLLVGLLPAFVNTPDCDDTKVAPRVLHNIHMPREESNIVQSIERQKIVPEVEKIQEVAVQRTKRSFSQKDVDERMAKFEERAKTNPFIKARRLPAGKADNLGLCPEIDKPTPGVQYPWYNRRLPTTIAPVKYNIELYTPEFGLEVYDGFMTITLEVKTATNFIILHAREEYPIFQGLFNQAGNRIDLSCLGFFQDNEYFVLKMSQSLTPGTYTLNLFFIGPLKVYDDGLFEFEYGQDLPRKVMIVSKFEPISARKAFPCFDEPQMKAIFNISMDHPNNTLALSNMPRFNDEGLEDIPDSIQTIFYPSPSLPPYMVAFAVFKKDDFAYEEGKASYNGQDIQIRVHARKELVDAGYTTDTLAMAIRTLEILLDLFRDVSAGVSLQAVPEKIDILASPFYPEDGIPHYGLVIFEETKVIFKWNSTSERDKQAIALLMAKNFAEFWFGNYVTFPWWDELYLQEAFSDYYKYIVANEAYPEFILEQQFITEELINVLVEDGYPSSHPIVKPNVETAGEIDEYFDSVERSKAAALFRMIDNELPGNAFLEATVSYLKKYGGGIGNATDFFSSLPNIRKWKPYEFAERWLYQANYPLLTFRIKLNADNNYVLSVNQQRALNSEFSIFGDDLLYPSPWDFIWFVPIKCRFGVSASSTDTHSQRFDLDTRSAEFVINTGKIQYKWFHCDPEFTGYYVSDYSVENWEALADVLYEKNPMLEPEDRATIIHNVFISAYTERGSYQQVVDVLTYLTKETDYIPWKTVSKHVNDMLGVLDYRRSFLPVAEYFQGVMANIENSIGLWEQSDVHVTELLKETILELACRVQEQQCLRNSTNLWPLAYNALLTGAYNNSIPPFIRETVYNYHFQNTYDVREWEIIFMEYDSTNDLLEREKFLQSLTYTRLPWLLATFIEARKTGKLELIDYFEAFKLLSKNPLGRELSWNFLRANYKEIVEQFSDKEPKIGQMLLDITSTFEDEFLFLELLQWIYITPAGASSNARFKALEIVSINNIWLADKEDQIIEAFSGERKSSSNKSGVKKSGVKKSGEFKAKATEWLKKYDLKKI